MTQPVVKERILDDDKTGLCNDKIQRGKVVLQYKSVKTQFSEQHDKQLLEQYEILKNETFAFYKNMMGPLNDLLLIRQIISDIEYVMRKERKCGLAKRTLAYNTFLQYLFQVENVNYDTYKKSNILNMIEEEFKNYKCDLVKIALDFHSGLKINGALSCKK